MKSRIYIVDDHPIVIEGLRKVIDRRDGMSVIGHAAAAGTALSAIANLKPEVLILDLFLPDYTAIDTIKFVNQRRPDTRVLVFSMHYENFYGERCLRAGAVGYVMKGQPIQHLLDAIDQISRGSFYFKHRTSQQHRLREWPSLRLPWRSQTPAQRPPAWRFRTGRPRLRFARDRPKARSQF